jgi:hypothetical protein
VFDESVAVNQASLLLRAQKFAAGSGSLIEFDILMNAGQNRTFHNYTVTASFDQGSVVGDILNSIRPVTTLQYYANLFIQVITNPLLIAIEIIIIPIIWVLLRRWIDKRHKRRLISEIVNYLLETRLDLLETPLGIKKLQLSFIS